MALRTSHGEMVIEPLTEALQICSVASCIVSEQYDAAAAILISVKFS